MVERSKCMNVPELRFKGFKQDWDFCSVGDFYYFKNGLNKGKEFFGYGTPIVNFTDVFNNRGLTSDILKGRVSLSKKEISSFEVKKGDIFFTRTSETLEEIGYPSVMLDESNDTVFSGFVLRGRAINEDPLSDLFKKYVFFTNDFRKEMIRKSSMTTRALTSGTSIKKMEFYFPENKMEQEKIGIFHSIIDKEIIFITTRIKLLKQVKAASLQSMFPQEGETVPKVRFKGFEREWEPVKLSKIGYMTAGGTPSTFVDKYWNGEINWLQSGIVQNRIIYTSSVERKITAEGLSNSAAHMIKKDSVLIAITGATCANIGYLTFESAANQSVVSIEPNNNFYSKFIYSSLISERSQILSFKGGSAQSGVTLANLKEILLKCPSFDEQVFIGDYFFSLEKNIELLTQRLEKLKQIKAACLDKMFV